MNLRKSILALSVVAGIVAAPMTVFAAHTHSWGSPQYYGYEDEMPGIYDDWDKCATRHVYNYKQCLICGEVSIYEVETIEMSHKFIIKKIESIENISKFLESTLSAFFDNMKGEINAKKQLSVLVLIILCFLLGCNRETPKDESQQNYEDESNISKTNGEELVNINSELLGSTPFDIQIDKTALQTRKETETEVTIKTNLTDWGYTVSSEKGKISDINKNSFIYIAPKDERDDTIKIQLSDYENGISYEYTIPLIFAGNNEHSLDKFKENLSRLPNS